MLEVDRNGFVILGLDPGIHPQEKSWIPAFAGMTGKGTYYA